LAPTLFKSLRFDPVKDFQPISAFSVVPVYILTNPALPASNFAELIDLVKKNPGKYAFGTPGVGTIHHLAFEAVKAQFGLDVVHAPYRGTSQLVPAIINGEVLIAVQGYPQVREYIDKGALRVLAVSSAKRSATAPQVPSLTELGVSASFALGSGLLAPAKTPTPVIERLASEMKKILSYSDTQRRLVAAGAEPINEGPEEFAARIRDDVIKYRDIARIAGLKAE
jgi:tripartite-type tricarboxylate transporter receptor subunit TctC